MRRVARDFLYKIKNKPQLILKFAIFSGLFIAVALFQNCSDIQVSRLSQNAVACVDAIDSTALFVRGYTPVSNGVPDTSEIHFEILVDTGGDTFARSGYVADWTLDGVAGETTDIFEIDTPLNCVDHVVQAKINLCGTEYTLSTIPSVMRFGTGTGCTPPDERDPPPPDTSGPTVSIPGSGGAAQLGTCGEPVDPNYNPFPPGYDLAEPGQPAACMNIVNWGQNSQGVRDRIINANSTNDIRIAHSLIRDTTMNTIFGIARCDLGLTNQGLSADHFISLRIDTTVSHSLGGPYYPEGILDLSNGTPDNYRPFQTVISECVGDFGTTYTSPSTPPLRNRRAALGPRVGRCGWSSLRSNDNQPKLLWQIRSRADIAAAALSTSILDIDGPCLLEEGKTYYINIIQSNPNNIFETICHSNWPRLNGCSAPGSCPLTDGYRMSCANSLILQNGF